MGQVQLLVGHKALSGSKLEFKIPFQVAALRSSGIVNASMIRQISCLITRYVWLYVPASAGLPTNPFQPSVRSILGTWTATGKDLKTSSC